MSEISIAFGQLVRKHRKEKNISQEKLALLCSLDRSYMGRIERGEVNITIERLYELAKALEIDVHKLLP
ncbi:helix-turn-helix domain-containing protein [Acinetobacter lwoffii]|uniref:helix-turn-helix domain-containing protein n=1 Tax=Acinetobacter lwoffii TaxID=28090 RepID=UPI00209AB680|nr:helix-turn-helix transcriptional regulator [Acinetobacter lwoffii]MCO8113938.1 helix-turn-helix domain-containing protein [Acinetobacter lwoffii]